MPTRTLPLVALLVLGVTHLSARSASTAAVSNEETVALALQQRVNLAESKLNVHFVGYRDDRCPSDVQCAWAGEARAFFWVSGAGLKPQVLTLSWDGSAQPERHSQRVGAFRFYLRSLEPRPLQAGGVVPTEYKAVLQVSR